VEEEEDEDQPRRDAGSGNGNGVGGCGKEQDQKDAYASAEALEGCSPEPPGGSHQAAGNSGRRWMIARSATTDRIRLTDRLVRQLAFD